MFGALEWNLTHVPQARNFVFEKTSFQEEISLRNATSTSHPDLFEGRVFESFSGKAKQKDGPKVDSLLGTPGGIALRFSAQTYSIQASA